MWYAGETNPQTGRPYGDYPSATSQGSKPPENCECNSGDPVEVIIWYPSNGHGAQGWGGHVSYNIDGFMFSWEGKGWARLKPASQYIEENKAYRTGTGYVLDFGSREKNRAFANSIKHAYEGQDPLFGVPSNDIWPYNLITNNCGHALSRALWDNRIGLDIHIAPMGHQQYIEQYLQGATKKRNLYPYNELRDALRNGGMLDQMMREVNRQRRVSQ
jgi:hypothetical protein